MPLACRLRAADNPAMPVKPLRLSLSLAVCAPGCTLLGAMAADTYFPSWGGALIGGSLGLFFGLAFGGVLPRAVATFCFRPDELAQC